MSAMISFLLGVVLIPVCVLGGALAITFLSDCLVRLVDGVGWLLGKLFS